MILKIKFIFKILKFIFVSSILIFFIGYFQKIYSTLPSNIYIKIVFSLVYIWFTIGINVNLILPLLKILDKKIKNL